MVRSFPSGENQIIHPEISLSLLVAGMAAMIAMITTLCGVRSQRGSPPSEEGSSSPTADTKKEDETALPPAVAGESVNDGEGRKELPLPPKMQQSASPSPSPSTHISKSASERRLNRVKSLSMKVPRSLSLVKNHLEEGRQKIKEKSKAEESIWTKTIILGEKCKVSEELEDGVIYEGKGKKISAYHPRAHSVMSNISMSRQGSAIDAQPLPTLQSK